MSSGGGKRIKYGVIFALIIMFVYSFLSNKKNFSHRYYALWVQKAFGTLLFRIVFFKTIF